MVIRMDAAPSGLTVWLSGELDHHSARSLREQVDAAVARSDAKLSAPLSGDKPVVAPSRGCAYHQFTGGYDFVGGGLLSLQPRTKIG